MGQPDMTEEHNEYRYKNNECRCELCKAAHAEYHRKYRARTPGKNAKLVRDSRARRLQQGVCIYCGGELLTPRMCARHACDANNYNRRIRGLREISLKEY